MDGAGARVSMRWRRWYDVVEEVTDEQLLIATDVVDRLDDSCGR